MTLVFEMLYLDIIKIAPATHYLNVCMGVHS